jgi:hypothetical protein
MDAVAFADVGIGNPPAAYPADVQTVQAANAWLPKDCGGALCTYVSNPTVVAISVDWSGCDSAATMSVHRKANMDSDQATDWALGAQTFGATNP